MRIYHVNMVDTISECSDQNVQQQSLLVEQGGIVTPEIIGVKYD